LETLDEFVNRELNPRFAGGRYIVKPFDVMFSPELEEATIDFGYVTRYYEVSEAVASGVEQHCVEDNLSPEECEELFEQVYRDELEELNNECVIRLNKVLEFPELGARAEIHPLKCDGDYCYCGADITLKIKLRDTRTIEDVIKKIVESTRHAMNRIMPEIINA
jgi:hypothetical protein